MVDGIRFEVVTPYKLVFSELVKSVVAPGILGEFGVLPGHTPFLTTLKIGSIRFVDMKGRESFIFISGGFAEALPDKVVVLAESAEERKDINFKRAEASLKRAKQRIEKVKNLDFKDEEIDLERARYSLNRAILRLKLAQEK